MRRFRFRGILAASGLVVVLLVGFGAAGLARPRQGKFFPSKPIGLADVLLTAADHLVEDEALIRVRAFIPTRGGQGGCLATLAESNFPTSGSMIFCAPREVDGVSGINVHLVFPPDPPLVGGESWTVTVFQQHAKEYGEPEIFDGP